MIDNLHDPHCRGVSDCHCYDCKNVRANERAKIVAWLNRHPLYTAGLHGQKRGAPTPQYLADEIEAGCVDRNEYPEITRE